MLGVCGLRVICLLACFCSFDSGIACGGCLAFCLGSLFCCGLLCFLWFAVGLFFRFLMFLVGFDFGCLICCCCCRFWVWLYLGFWCGFPVVLWLGRGGFPVVLWLGF